VAVEAAVLTTKVQVLLALRAGAAAVELEQRLAADSDRFRGLVAGAYERRLIRLADDPTRATEHGEEVGGEAVSFDAVVELGGIGVDPYALADAVEPLGGWLDDCVDADRSAAVVGTEHVVVPGDEPLHLVYALRRLPALTPEAFRDHWQGPHAEIGRSVPGSQGYRQVHGDPAASARAAKAAGVRGDDFDGVAEAYYRDVDAFLAIIQQPAIIEVALADEARFIDRARSPIGIFRAVEAG